MARAFMYSLLRSQAAQLKEGFTAKYPHPWLIWEANRWLAPPLDGATRLDAGAAVPSAQTSAQEPLLCFYLQPRDGGNKATIGRAAENAMVVNDGSVSRQHAEVWSEGATWKLGVLTPRLRTFYEGRVLVKGSVIDLRDGARLELGDVALVFLSSQSLLRRLSQSAA